MKEEYKNIPAFPENVHPADNSFSAFRGMTLRDYFAGQALSGMSQLARDDDPDRLAHYCFVIADAMMQERDT